jgi:NAD(P)H-dependent FMN reductase
MLKIGIILGSTRPNRIGSQIATWVYDVASKWLDRLIPHADLERHDAEAPALID